MALRRGQPRQVLFLEMGKACSASPKTFLQLSLGVHGRSQLAPGTRDFLNNFCTVNSWWFLFTVRLPELVYFGLYFPLVWLVDTNRELSSVHMYLKSGEICFLTNQEMEQAVKQKYLLCALLFPENNHLEVPQGCPWALSCLQDLCLELVCSCLKSSVEFKSYKFHLSG